MAPSSFGGGGGGYITNGGGSPTADLLNTGGISFLNGGKAQKYGGFGGGKHMIFLNLEF